MISEETGKFDYCDDITSGYMEGICEGIQSDKTEANRKAQWSSVSASWPKADQIAFEKLQKVAADFFQAREDNEVDLSGTARGAEQIEEREDLENDFLGSIKDFESGQLPAFSDADFAKSDSRLNDDYTQIMHATKEQWEGFVNGTVEQKGIQTTQRKWLSCRDAWVQFGAIHYPKVPASAWKTWFTQKRLHQLEDFLGQQTQQIPEK